MIVFAYIGILCVAFAVAAAALAVGIWLGELWDRRHVQLSQVDREWLAANGVRS